MVGETLAGRYRIDAALGAGATAVVYRARDLRLERDVAVKVLLPNLARDPLIAGRFDREARALAAAAHPGIVSVYDVDPGDIDAGREPFFVMELCDGGSLADALEDAGGTMAPSSLVPMLAIIAGGLASLHARGVIHRDVKPHNILLCGGRAKLADFGLARGQEATRLTAAGTGAGTLAYLAPELLGDAEPGPAADVYGLGVVAFQGLTGRLPRPSASMVDLVESRLASVAAISAIAPGLGTAFDAVIAGALSPDPAARPSPLAFGAGMEQALRTWRTAGTSGDGGELDGQPNDKTQELRLPRGARRRGGTANRRRGLRRRSLLGPVVAALALAGLGAIVILAVLQSGVVLPRPSASPTAASTGEPTPSPSESPSPSPSPTPSLTVSPTESPTPVPTPIVAPTATPSPAITPVPTPFRSRPPTWSPAIVQQQLDNLYTAIANAEASASFSDPADADRLRGLASAVQDPLDRRNQHETALAVQKISRAVDQIVAGLGLQNSQELVGTVTNLVNAAGPP